MPHLNDGRRSHDDRRVSQPSRCASNMPVCGSRQASNRGAVRASTVDASSSLISSAESSSPSPLRAPLTRACLDLAMLGATPRTV